MLAPNIYCPVYSVFWVREVSLWTPAYFSISGLLLGSYKQRFKSRHLHDIQQQFKKGF